MREPDATVARINIPVMIRGIMGFKSWILLFLQVQLATTCSPKYFFLMIKVFKNKSATKALDIPIAKPCFVVWQGVLSC